MMYTFFLPISASIVIAYNMSWGKVEDLDHTVNDDIFANLRKLAIPRGFNWCFKDLLWT